VFRLCVTSRHPFDTNQWFHSPTFTSFSLITTAYKAHSCLVFDFSLIHLCSRRSSFISAPDDLYSRTYYPFNYVMRTRARGTASLPRTVSLPSPPPTGHRRKREEVVTDSGANQPTADYRNAANHAQYDRVDDENIVTTTPQKPAKRVRFSDPGPSLDSPPSHSSGLTPRLRRTTLAHKPRTPRTAPRSARRNSVPQNYPSSSSPLAPVSELQFTTLKQVLDDRIRRRLRRSHLSEEINDIEEHQRNETRKKHQELAQLREDCVKKEETIKELQLELELQRQRGIEVNAEEDERVTNLQKELESFKQELLHREADPQSVQPGSESDVPTEPDYTMLTSDDINSTWEEATIPSSPPLLSRHTESFNIGSTDASTQAALQDPAHEAELQFLRAAISRYTDEAYDAKAALESVRVDLQSLGFGNKDASMEELVFAIRAAFRKARLDLEYLLPGETAVGFENNILLQTMIEHVRSLFQHVEECGKIADRHQQSESALRGQFNRALEKVAAVEKETEELVVHLECARREATAVREETEKIVLGLREDLQSQSRRTDVDKLRIMELETENEEQATTVARLQKALESYRAEVSSLEALVTLMEKNDKTKMLEDVECQLEDYKRLMHDAMVRAAEQDSTVLTLRREVDDSRSRMSAGQIALETAHEEIRVVNQRLTKSNDFISELRKVLYDAGTRFEEHICSTGDIMI